MTTTTTTVRPGSTAGLKLFAGAVSGLSAALITSSLLYLAWFIPLGRPGSHIPTVEQIVPTIQAAGDTRSADELRKAAESTRSGMEFRARFIWTPLEVLILTSTCLVAAYFAALYARTHDEGEGRPLGSLKFPTLAGTAVGAVVLWALLYLLVAKPAEAHPSAHGTPAAATHALPGPAPAVADHGSQPPASSPRAEAVHDDHGSKDWSAWLAENVHPAELIAFLVGTLAAAAVATLAPRGAARTTTATSGHSYAPAH